MAVPQQLEPRFDLSKLAVVCDDDVHVYDRLGTQAGYCRAANVLDPQSEWAECLEERPSGITDQYEALAWVNYIIDGDPKA